MSRPEQARDPDPLWQRARQRTTTAVLGRVPDPPAELQLLRVSCEVAPAALRPLLEARRMAEAIVGEARAKPERARATRWRTLFGETPERATEAVVVELWNRLARQKGTQWVVVFDAVERADEATLAALVQIVRRPGWLQLPLLLVFHGDAEGPAAELLAAVREQGDDAVLRGQDAAIDGAPDFAWRSLPTELLRVLRAGALIGPGFEIRILAELLSLEPLTVLEQIQRAIDLGVPVEDRGEGRFSLPHAALSALTASLLPSLAQAWHRKLGRLLGARAAREAATPPPPPLDSARVARLRRDRVDETRVAHIVDLSGEVREFVAEADAGAPGTAGGGSPAGAMSGVFAARGATDSGAPPVPSAALQDALPMLPEPLTDEPVEPVEPVDTLAQRELARPPATASPAPAERGAEEPLIDAVRAAEHMRLAGEFDAAAEHLCAAARQAAEMGAPQTAARHATEALALLASSPTSALRRELRVRTLIELGRVQWQAAGYDLGFTLAQALASLDAAKAELDADAPVDLAVELAEAIAGVCFDLGDQRSLERALAELEGASQVLTEAGDTTGAACLLNDQAAVRVRMADPVQALRLLRESRRVFDARGRDDEVALRELAETEHLFAKLPLHAQMRVGHEVEGFTMGLKHAGAAERAFRELDDRRELARVWETMGRLALRLCNVQEARQRLEAAFAVQTQIGDLTGLAHTTEVLSEVLAWSGKNAEAVALLRDSVVSNRDKGSPIGLMLNRRGFTALASRLARLPEHAEGLREVEVLLKAGERELGILPPPDATDAR